jgi:predicted enzyme related to lactoylglutathione lyase
MPGYQAPSSIGQVAIPVQDVDRAIAFYRDVLGLRFLFSAPPGLAFFECGNVRLMLSKPEGTGAGSSGVVYYRTTALQATCDELMARGATIQSPPRLIARMPDHQLWMGFVLDSEGNSIGLMEERPLA